jgi:hypothetical protein
MPKPENIIAHKMKPGETRNPNGRPKGARSRSTIVREWLDTKEVMQNPITGKTQRMSQADVMTLALIKKARKGDVAAFRELFDSAYGKNPDIIMNPDGTGINQNQTLPAIIAGDDAIRVYERMLKGE